MTRQDALQVLREMRGTTPYAAINRLLDLTIEDEKEKLITAEGSAMLHGQGAVQALRRLKAEIARNERPKTELDGAY